MTGRLIFGFGVIFLGLLFLLQELGSFDADVVLRWWPIALIAFGLMKLTGTGSRPNLVAGTVFTLVGTWMLLRSLDVLPFGLRDFWPILLIAIGITMVAGGFRRRSDAPGPADADSTLSAFALWSGVDRKVTTQDFRGGELTAIMGGHEIDLRPAKMTGGSAAIDLFVMMGGIDLRIPEDWALSSEVVPVMGAVEDHTRPPAGEVRGRLILKGFVLMGGVEVKN